MIVDRAGGSIRFFDHEGTETVKHRFGQFTHIGAGRAVSHVHGLTFEFTRDSLFVKILGAMRMGTGIPGFDTEGQTQVVLTFPAGRVLSAAEPADVTLLLTPHFPRDVVERARPLFAQLQDQTYAVRNAAEQQLAALGPAVVPLVERFLNSDPSLEPSIHGRNVLLALKRVELARRDGLDHDLTFLASLLDHAPPRTGELARRRLVRITSRIRPHTLKQSALQREWLDWLKGVDAAELRWDAHGEQYVSMPEGAD